MLRKGDIIYNPVSGETYTLLKTSADTLGALLQADVTVEPGGGPRKPPLHLHPRQQETFRIRSGKISVTVNGRKQVYGPGETLVIPAGTPHRWENESGRQELHFIWELAPAMQAASMLETIGALSQAQKRSGIASGSFLQLALILDKYPHHYLLAGIPAWLQRALFKLLAPLALVLGYRPKLDYKAVVAGKNLNGLHLDSSD